MTTNQTDGKPDVDVAAADCVHGVSLLFSNLANGSKARVVLRDQQAISLDIDRVRDRLVGLSLASTQLNTALQLKFFTINSQGIFIETNNACESLELKLYVRSQTKKISGYAELPQDGSLKLESLVDRSTIIDRSSFSIDLS